MLIFKGILQIQSCLASLEYLETELIPCLTALYVSCSYKNKSNFQHLIDFWLNEMTALKGLIDSILDPAGFCEVLLKLRILLIIGIQRNDLKHCLQIVENEITNLMTTFKNALYDDVSLIRANSIFLKIIRYSRKLIKTLRRNLEDESHIEEETENSLRNFQLGNKQFFTPLWVK